MANLITLARILLVVPFAAMFFIDWAFAPTVALVLFVVAAASDFLDGWVARARGEVSALGAALDPVADKLLVAAALLLLVRNGVIRDAAVVAALAILLREIFVGGLREALGARARVLPVTALAKWKTAAQLVAIGLLLAAAPGGPAPGLGPVAQGLFWFAAVLTLWTGADYARRGVAALRAPG
ncbi:MAG: CDP-diacylglycerol--glycerol-3-phosphate 3-phosphatidyltransferase [Parvularculaceae bacterium]|nr:CDP-diacylglycerol--glycerol-3-phosphate 3-phosphatidyltransferase [Parvularculaceae bacterium]